MIVRYLLLLFVFVSTVALAQDGTVDTTFQPFSYHHSYPPNVTQYPRSSSFAYNMIGPWPEMRRYDAEGNQLFRFGDGNHEFAEGSICQEDGKTLLYGHFNYNTLVWNDRTLIRLKDDFSIDTSFNPPRFKLLDSVSGLSSMIQFHDGKYLLLGNFTSVGEDTTNRHFIYLHNDGHIDTSSFLDSRLFDANYIYFDVILLKDGSLLHRRGNGMSLNYLHTLVDGSMDTTFHPDRHFAYPLELHSGKFASISGDTIFRFHSNGRIDNSFRHYRASEFSGTTYWPTILAEQSDGRLLISRLRHDPAPPDHGHLEICRLNINGDYDSSFRAYAVPDYRPESISGFIQPSGKLVVWPIFIDYSTRTSIRLYCSDSTIPLAAPKPDFIVNSRTVYEGDTARFTNRTPSGMRPGPVGYTWSVSPATGWTFTGGSDSSSKNPSIRFSRAGRYSLSLQSAFDSLRADTTKTDYITVLPVPAPKPDFWADTTPIYAGTSVPFSNATPPPIRPSTVEYRWAAEPDTGWEFKTGSSESSLNPEIRFLAEGLYNIRLTSKVGSQTADTVKAAYIRVLPVPVPDPDFSCADQVYEGDSVEFHNQTFPPIPYAPSYYTWQVNPTKGVHYQAGDSTSESPSLRFDSAGTYSITLRCRVGAHWKELTKADYLTVRPVPAPQPDFQAIQRRLNAGDSTYIVNYTSFPIVPRTVTYQWDLIPDTGWVFTAGSSSGSESVTIRFHTPGSYSVRLTSRIVSSWAEEFKNDYITVDPVTDTRKLTIPSILRLRPNPAHDAVHVQSTAQIRRLNLIDALGRTVYTTQPESTEVMMPLQDLPAGLYQVQAETNMGSLQARLMKE